MSSRAAAADSRIHVRTDYGPGTSHKSAAAGSGLTVLRLVQTPEGRDSNRGAVVAGVVCFWREGLSSEHALDDEVRQPAAHLRQLIFNRKNGHRLAGDRCRIQSAEHLEQLVDFL